MGPGDRDPAGGPFTGYGDQVNAVAAAEVDGRPKTPDGAEQEIWALLCAYHAIREIICAAAALARQDPLRIPFANALDVVRGPVGSPGIFSPSPG